jgi:hypothetical protein
VLQAAPPSGPSAAAAALSLLLLCTFLVQVLQAAPPSESGPSAPPPSSRGPGDRCTPPPLPGPRRLGRHVGEYSEAATAAGIPLATTLVLDGYSDSADSESESAGADSESRPGRANGAGSASAPGRQARDDALFQEAVCGATTGELPA